MKNAIVLLFLCIVNCYFMACSKVSDGMPDPAGGNLPTNYVFIQSTGFTPQSITVVNGSTVTFINQSGATVGIVSSDSVVINKQNLAANTSYIFKKDTTGTIFYNLAGKPSVNGSITLTP